MPGHQRRPRPLDAPAPPRSSRDDSLDGALTAAGPARHDVYLTVPWPAERLALSRPPVCVATVHPCAVLRSRTRDADLEALVADLRAAAAVA